LKLARPLRQSADDDALIFPGFSKQGDLSSTALLALIHRAGFHTRQTPHGMRASFSTWANERQVDPDVIEACLAHSKQGVRGTYNRAKYLPQRTALLQQWGTQLEQWGMQL
jgi:integrase